METVKKEKDFFTVFFHTISKEWVNENGTNKSEYTD